MGGATPVRDTHFHDDERAELLCGSALLSSLLPLPHHPRHAIAFARQVADVLHALDVVRRDAQLLTQIVLDRLRHPLRGVLPLAHVL